MRKRVLLPFLMSLVIVFSSCANANRATQSESIAEKNESSTQIQAQGDGEELAMEESFANIEMEKGKEVSLPTNLEPDTTISSDNFNVMEIEGTLENDNDVGDYVDSHPKYEELVQGKLAEGNIVMFGRFEQDNNLENGPEPVEWRVAEVSDGKATLLPVKCLMWGDASEADSELQTFIDSAFDNNELSLVESCSLISDNLFDKFASFRRKAAYETVYDQNELFSFMVNYSEYALALGAFIYEGNRQDGVYQSQSYIWTQFSSAVWVDTPNDKAVDNMIAVNSTKNPHQDRLKLASTKSSTIKRGICPYVIICTEESADRETE